MNKNRILPAALAAVIITAAGSGLAFAKERGEEGYDAAALANAKITLQQAITTAEQQANGRAVSADLTQEHGKPMIEVEVAESQGVRTVHVDAQSGQVTASNAGDQADNDQD